MPDRHDLIATAVDVGAYIPLLCPSAFINLSYQKLVETMNKKSNIYVALGS
jgi:hypothetical protein